MPKKPKIPSSRVILHSIFNREGTDIKPSKKVNISDLHSASVSLFKHVLAKNDVRWRLAYQYSRLLKEKKVTPLNLENAMQAIYLSTKARSSRGASYLTAKTLTHLARALNNIELGSELLGRLSPLVEIGKGYNLLFEKTKMIRRGKDRRGVTGCPEALWQLQLYHKNEYLGRIGFNFHLEDGKIIASITNIQGAEGQLKMLDKAEEDLGEAFGSFLIKKLKEFLKEEVEYMGIRDLSHLGKKAGKKRTALYRMSFRKANVPLVRH